MKKISLNKEIKLIVLVLFITLLMLNLIFSNYTVKDNRKRDKEKFNSIAISMSSILEIYFHNIERQAEYIGNQILSIKEKNKEEDIIRDILTNNFSLDTSLDTSLISSWKKFKWVPFKTENKRDALEEKEKWILRFGRLRKIGFNKSNSYIPIRFNINNEKGGILGRLESEIFIEDIVSYIRYNIRHENIDFILLDNSFNIVGKSIVNGDELPVNFFKKENTVLEVESKELDKKFLASKEIKNYPFTIIVGSSRSYLDAPLITSLIRNSILIILTFGIVMGVFFYFYRKIFVPITNLSDYAKKIIDSDREVRMVFKKHTFKEINNLEDALKQFCSFKKELLKKNEQLLEIKKEQEENIRKLCYSAELKEDLFRNSEKFKKLSVKEIIEICVSILYPEIYSKQILIINKINKKEKTPEHIKKDQLTKVILILMSRSCIFLRKSGKIKVFSRSVEIEKEKYFSLIIEDNGLGNEGWRRDKLHNKDLAEVDLILAENDGKLKAINNKDNGVKYTLVFSLKEIEKKDGVAQDLKIVNKDKNNKGNINNIIKFKTEQ